MDELGRAGARRAASGENGPQLATRQDEACGMTRGTMVVALEFATEIPRRSLAHLLPTGAHALTKVIDPLANPALVHAYQSLVDQASYWTDQLVPDGSALLVLAYCSGAPLAEALVDAWPVSARAVLLDPAEVGLQSARPLLTELALKLDPALDPSAVPDLSGLGAEEVHERAGNFLKRILATVAPDLPSHIAENLSAKQKAWFAYGISACNRDPSRTRRSRAFLSAQGSGAEARPAAAQDVLPVSHADLFESSVVRDEVRRLALVLAGPSIGASVAQGG